MKIHLHKNFEKKFRKLQPGVKQKFRERRDLFLENPFHPLLRNHPLMSNREGQWSINITGDWRVAYIWKAHDTVVFLDIDTHSNLYG